MSFKCNVLGSNLGCFMVGKYNAYLIILRNLGSCQGWHFCDLKDIIRGKVNQAMMMDFLQKALQRR